METEHSAPLVVAEYGYTGTRENPNNPVDIRMSAYDFFTNIAKLIRVQLGDDKEAPIHTLWLSAHRQDDDDRKAGKVWVSCIRIRD